MSKAQQLLGKKLAEKIKDCKSFEEVFQTAEAFMVKIGYTHSGVQTCSVCDTILQKQPYDTIRQKRPAMKPPKGKVTPNFISTPTGTSLHTARTFDIKA